MKYLLPFALILVLVSCEEKINTSVEFSSDWSFRKQGDTSYMPITIPGAVHSHLVQHNSIDLPYRNNNELEQEWVERENWEYQTTWMVSKELLENEHIELDFKGLDTYADIYLNDTLRLSTDNMFREWQLEVKPFLKEGANTLKVVFNSPINRNTPILENYKYKLPSGNETVQEKVGSFTRKAAYHFGWDWGPRFVTAGFWRPIRLNIWNQARLRDINIQTIRLSEGQADLRIDVTVEVDQPNSFNLLIDGRAYSEKLDSGTHTLSYNLAVQNPELWWPNGMGKQTLYYLNVELQKGSSTIDQVKKHYGIRTIELINEPDSIGTSYYFKVNGKPFFAKGANYIPQDMFLPTVDSARYVNILSKARDANMNMLRVWGGGVYENDFFYDLCDQYGLMVWQDFMFAGSMYPSDESFHATLVEEARDNIRRIRSHPSLALWCGNNEMEVAWNNWGWQKGFRWSKEDSTDIWNNYLKIFHTKLPAIVNELNPEVPYVPTSPLSNWGKKENFNNSSMHYWGVWHGREPFEKFKENVPRFMVEYGFQSFPSYSSMTEVIDSSKMNLKSDVMTNRQKSYIGNGMITLYAEKYFGKAPDFKTYIDNSQKTQAIGYRMAIQAHRLGKPHCMGTMFWQLNDCWQGPSWSILEYDGTPKAAYAEVKKWYQPVIAVGEIEKDQLRLTLVSDLMNEEKFQLNVELIGKETTTFEKKITLNERLEMTIPAKNLKGYKLTLKQGSKLVFEDELSM